MASPAAKQMEPVILLAALILFAGSLTRSTFGFGEALVAMPLLTMVVDTRSAAAIIALTSVFNALTILLTTGWKEIDWESTWRLLIGSIAGVPLGVYALKAIDEWMVKLVLAALVISFAIYKLAKPQLAAVKGQSLGFVFGFFAGVLGGAYCTLGPPLVIFGAIKQWKPDRFRTTLQAVFFPTSMAIVCSHYAVGFWTPQVFRCFLLGVPCILIATFLGKALHQRMDHERFSRAVFVMLLVIGVMLLTNVARDLQRKRLNSTTSRSTMRLVSPVNNHNEEQSWSRRT